LLSAMPRSDAMAIIEKAGLPKLSEKTITQTQDFIAELDKVKKLGFALDDEEQTPGLRCIASNIYDEYGEAIAAVSISGPSVRIPDDRIADIAEKVIRKAAAITHAIGGVHPRTD